jgi:hypothetical protein
MNTCEGAWSVMITRRTFTCRRCHPLSMTCKQMRAEFQDAHFTARNACWTLLINNFDLEQLHLFDDYITSGCFIRPAGSTFDTRCQFVRSKYNVTLLLRFQMDSNAVSSAKRLRDLVSSSDEDIDMIFALERCADVRKIRKSSPPSNYRSSEACTKHDERRGNARWHLAEKSIPQARSYLWGFGGAGRTSGEKLF